MDHKMSKSLGFEVNYSPSGGNHSSPSESTSLSQQELARAISQDQSGSSDSAYDGGYGKHVQSMGPSFLSNPEFAINASQAEISHPIVPLPYAAYPDPYFTGLLAAYGSHHPSMQPHQVMGTIASSCRVPLPPDFPEDGPIFVNAKQFQAILRRRQTRAKLESQNKLIKNRRPYLHESRHQHAMNRVRGSGGRFLSSSKKTQQPDSSELQHTNSQSHVGPFHFDRKETSSNDHRKHQCPSTNNGTNRVSSDGDAMFRQQQQPDEGGFSSMGSHSGGAPVQGGGGGGGGGGGLVYGGNRYYTSIVR